MKDNQLDTIVQFIDEHDAFAILGHKEPDGDCLGSQLALASFLRRIGKKADVFSAGPFDRPEIRFLESQFRRHIPEDLAGTGVGIIVDCSTLERIGALADEVNDLRLAVIDHHASGEDFGNPRYVETGAPSVTFIIQRIIERMGHEVTREEAELLLFGLSTDTGFFRHLTAASGQAFRQTAKLVDAGASPRKVHQMMYGGRSLGSRRLLGRLLARAVEHCDGRVLLTYELLADREQLEAYSDSDTMYQQLTSVSDCLIVVYLREEGEQEWSVGLRSTEDIDVGSVAKHFGGGGHRNASGYTSNGTRESISAPLFERLEQLL